MLIGSGPAGQRAARGRQTGQARAVVERNEEVGGGSILRGTIPSKTLREAVSDLSGARQRQIYGIAYRVKERITIEDLGSGPSGLLKRVVENEINIVRDQLIRNYVDVVVGTGSFIDPHQVLVTTAEETRRLITSKVIIAVGSKPGRPPGIEFDDRHIVDSDGLLRLPEIPRTMTVVGAGIVGIEYATIFQTLGVNVTLIDGNILWTSWTMRLKRHSPIIAQRRDIIAIAGEHLVPERQAFARDDQRQIDLLAVRAVIARIPALCLRITRGLPLEIGRRHIIEQQIVLHCKQLPQPVLEMLLQRRLMGQELVEGAVEPIVVDFGRRHAQEIGQRTSLVEVLGQAQLAAQRTEPPSTSTRAIAGQGMSTRHCGSVVSRKHGRSRRCSSV